MTGALTAAGGASVGAERFDSLESLISEVNNKVLSVKGQMDDEITILGTRIDSTNSIMETNIQARIHALLADIDKDLNEVRSGTSGTGSEIIRTRQHLETLIDEVRRIAVETRNLIGRG
jgi:archaellum component FlaC